MSDNLILTEEEEKITHYCEDFCPLYEAIRDFNRNKFSTITCATEMCTNVVNAFILDRRQRQALYGKDE